MHVQCCCFVNLNMLFLAVLLDVAVIVALVPYNVPVTETSYQMLEV